MTAGYHIGDALELLAAQPAKSVHMVFTSPPYYALRSYLPADHPSKDREIGSEPTLDAFIGTMVAVFRQVYRVLRDDGTLWLNLGDGYASQAMRGSFGDQGDLSTGAHGYKRPKGAWGDIAPKNLVGVPWRVALALQADGWILRSDIIWAKPNPMPESCRDRPTSAHEHVFLFSKRAKYFYDGDAVREGATGRSCGNREYKYDGLPGHETKQGILAVADKVWHNRNLRNVWTIPTQAVKHKHYATFPERLVEPAIKAGTSQEGVCAECGGAWERVVEVGGGNIGASWHPHEDDLGVGTSQCVRADGGDKPYDRTTTGWRPTCQCFDAVAHWQQRDFSPPAKVPATVLDPFMGSGTVARVAERLGRNWLGFDLDERNAEMCELRLKRNQMEMTL